MVHLTFWLLIHWASLNFEPIHADQWKSGSSDTCCFFLFRHFPVRIVPGPWPQAHLTPGCKRKVCVRLWSSRSTSDGGAGTGKSTGIRADSGSRLIASSRRCNSLAISLELLSLASYSFNLSHKISLDPQTGALRSFNRFLRSLTFEVGPRSTGLSAAPPSAGSSSPSSMASGGATSGGTPAASGARGRRGSRSSSSSKIMSSPSGGSSSASKPLAWIHPSIWTTRTDPLGLRGFPLPPPDLPLPCRSLAAVFLLRFSSRAL